MKPFVSNPFPTLGIEQEFHLIAPQGADLVPRYDEVMRRLDPGLRAAMCHELFYSVMEMRSPVCRSASELEDHVRADRQSLAQACAQAGCRLVAAASHPFARWTEQTIVQSDHYRWVAQEAVYLARRLLAFGLHVHVGVRTVETAFYVMNELQQWLYPLLALSANSPFLEGRPTGLDSTRAHLFDSMPRTNLPPSLSSFGDLELLYDKLVQTGEVASPGELWWSIRPQPPLGTVEIRILDLPTDVRRIGALTALIQALVATYQDRFQAGMPRSAMKREYLEQNHWQAMRHGLDGKVLDPSTGDVLPMRQQIERLLEFITPKAREVNSESQLVAARDILKTGNEAQWQIKRWRELDHDLIRLEHEIADRTVAT